MKEEEVLVVAAPEPETLNDYETERGKPMPNRIHGAIQTKLAVLLNQYSNKFQFPSEVSLSTNPPTTPDLCIYPQKKLDWRTIAAKESEMPLTTIEILSPSQALDELVAKAENSYFTMGVKSAWIVVPALKTIIVLLPDEQKLYFTTGMLEDPATGIKIPVEKVFEDLV